MINPNYEGYSQEDSREINESLKSIENVIFSPNICNLEDKKYFSAHLNYIKDRLDLSSVHENKQLAQRVITILQQIDAHPEIPLPNTKRSLHSIAKIYQLFYRAKLIPDFNQFDCIGFEIGQEQINIPKNLLAGLSDLYFIKQQSEFRNNKNSPLNISEDISKVFIEYLQTGDLTDLNGENCIELYELSHEFAIPSLQKACRRYITFHWDLENISAIFKISQKYDDKNLYLRCISEAFEAKMYKQVSEDIMLDPELDLLSDGIYQGKIGIDYRAKNLFAHNEEGLEWAQKNGLDYIKIRDENTSY